MENNKKPRMKGTIWGLFFIATFLLCIVGQAFALPPVVVETSSTQILISNGFVKAGFDLVHPQLNLIAGDHTGAGQYSSNLFATGDDRSGLFRNGFVLEHDFLNADGHFSSAASSLSSTQSIHFTVTQHDPSAATVVVDGVLDSVDESSFVSTWTLNLRSGDRSLGLFVNATATATTQTVSLRLSAYFSQASVFGCFGRGIAQMMNSPTGYFASDEPLHYIYALGDAGVELYPQNDSPLPSEQTVLLSSAGSANFYLSGAQFVLAGAFPTIDTWVANQWPTAHAAPIAAGRAFGWAADLYASQYAFPPHAGSDARTPMDGDAERAMLTAAFASTAGSFTSYAQPGHQAPTLATPERSYAPMTNFFDPDSWLSVTTLVYAGDAYMVEQARALLETNPRFILPSGQLPHHFIGDKPTYDAISGATQTGPNVFWTLAVLAFSRATGDYDWVRGDHGNCMEPCR
jgi:hypothetical protein